MAGVENNHVIGIQRVTLKKLEPDLNNVLIVGIIIGKQRPRRFTDSKATDPNVYKGVWNFTLRDSPQDYINVTYWEKADIVFEANDKFQTGDVVEIIRPKITVRRVSDYGEQFRPMVTSPYSLSINENSEILRHEGVALNVFTKLLHLPTKPVAGFVALLHVQNREDMESDVTVDVLGAVRNVGTTRIVKTKNNEEVQLREIILFDRTSQGVKLTIWEPDLITRASSWEPRTTILFLTDLRIEYSQFHRSYGVTTTSRTIVTENPVGREAEDLRTFAENVPLETTAILDQIITSIPDVNSIQTVMSIRQVQFKLNAVLQDYRIGENHFTALVYAVITQFDLDGLARITATRCGHCKTWLKLSLACTNDRCPVATGAQKCDPEVLYDIRIMLSDHTGSLINCRLANNVAENMLDRTASQFLNMTDDEKCMLKWKYLMERCAVRIVAMVNKSSPVISVVDCVLANKMEVAQRLPIY